MQDAPYHPIVYVRGYAGPQSSVEETVATPFMGFNLGATKTRQRWTGEVERHIFESPLIRLMKDHGYTDAYSDGDLPGAAVRVGPRSVWIYRYYEPVSEALGSGERPEIEAYAEGLDGFIERVRDHVCGPADDPEVQAARDAFRVYLVAHSMGGLIVRCYLQNLRGDGDHPVARVVTYGTPHRGIDLRLVGNIPGFLNFHNVENFNRDRMRQYLALADAETPVHSLDGRFDPDRFLCLIGSDHRDYEVAMGLSAAAVGPMSDGLVRIRNAYTKDSPRAFLHRAHSGHYGLVNSESGYQNLTRFLFGDWRLDGLLEVEAVDLPPKVRRAKDAGRAVRASYHVEVIVRVRGARWDLHRRTADEGSALFRDYDSLVHSDRPLTLFSTFLADWGRVNRRRRGLGVSVDLRVLVPEYEVDGEWFGDDHFDGGYLFRDKLNLAVAPDGGRLDYGWDRGTPNRTSRPAEPDPDRPGEFLVPVRQRTRPGLSATLRLRLRPA